MKNQYVGDIGDYGKYGLLRFLIGNGVCLGVNWYLTPNDAGNDGCHTEYLSDERMRAYDPAVYDAMKQLAFLPREIKNVQMVEDSGILKDAVFYHELLNLKRTNYRFRGETRKEWHEKAMEAMTPVKLVFADPDNGLFAGQKHKQSGGEKYLLPEEARDYYDRGQDVLYYHHRPRKNEAEWLVDKTYLKGCLEGVKLLAVTSHRWTNRAYIFAVHPQNYGFYRELVQSFLESPWGALKTDGRRFFTAEEV